MTEGGYKPIKFSLKGAIVVLYALLVLLGCDDSNEKPIRTWTEVYKEYPDGTVVKWEVAGPIATKDGCVSWRKSAQEEIRLCGSISAIVHRDPVEVPAKTTDNEKDSVVVEKGGDIEKKKESE